MSNLLPFMRTGEMFWLCLREMTACVVLLWLNETRLSSPHSSITVRSLVRRLSLKLNTFQKDILVRVLALTTLRGSSII